MEKAKRGEERFLTFVRNDGRRGNAREPVASRWLGFPLHYFLRILVLFLPRL